MNIILITLTLALVGATFAHADTLSPLRTHAYIDAARAADESISKKIFNHEKLSDAEIEKMNQIISEAEPLFNISPDTLEELRALGGPEPKGTAISAVELQETILDYESLNVGQTIPTLIAFYIAQNKTGGLQPKQRLICYVLVKSSIRKIQAAKAKE